MNKKLVEAYYDSHSNSKFVRNYVKGNRRIKRQKWFLGRSIPRDAQSVLVIGCGSGDVCNWLARRVTKKATICGVDISPSYVEIARKLFPHKRVCYHVANAIESLPAGPWDVIVFPDVYEHFSKADREALHRNIAAVTSEATKLVFTCPTPSHQRMLIERGWGLQPVDEIVDLADFQRVADDLGMGITCYVTAAVFRAFDYNYVVIERTPTVCAPLEATVKTPLRGWPNNPMLDRILVRSGKIFFPSKMREAVRNWHLKRRLGSGTTDPS